MHFTARICGTLLLLFVLPAGAATTIFISPDGPITSLTAARDSIRRLREQNPAKANEPVTVLLHAGTYWLSETFTLTAADSNVTYAAAPGEHVVISGGQV